MEDEHSDSSDAYDQTEFDSGFANKYDPDFKTLSRQELFAWTSQRNYSERARTNEYFNWISHLVTGIIATAATAYLIYMSDTGVKRFAFSYYLVSNAAMLFGSALHHGVGLGGFSINLYRFFRMQDHCGIFFVIAGTFAPYALVGGDTLGFAVFFYLNVIMTISIVLKAITRHTLNQNVFNAVYMLMGWSGIALFKKIVCSFGWGCIGLVLGGGLSYTAGLVCFQLEKPNPVRGVFCSHEIWHCFVSVGVLLHYLSMLFYVLPYEQSV